MCYLAEFTLAVEPALAIMIFITKWLIERAGNLTYAAFKGKLYALYIHARVHACCMRFSGSVFLIGTVCVHVLYIGMYVYESS